MKTSHPVLSLLVAMIIFSSACPSEGAASAEDRARHEAQSKAMAELGAAGRKERWRERERDAFPDIARFLAGKECADLCYELVIKHFCIMRDGWDTSSGGSPELLAATRDMLHKLLKENRIFETAATQYGLVYLAQKGNASDLPVIESYLAEPLVQTNDYLRTAAVVMPCRILRARVSGTNVVGGLFDQKLYPDYWEGGRGDSYSTNGLAFMPSVANTGPQAEYVYKAYWQAIGLQRSRVTSRDTPYSIITNVAPELLTMRVWFDADGKAVTDADLAKYGIEVLGLGFAPAAPAPQGPPPDAAPVDADAPPAAEASGPPPHSLFVAPLAAGAGLLAALLLWRGLRRRKP